MKFSKLFYLFLFVFAASGFPAIAQLDSITNEGMNLYRLEKAAWFGTDCLMKDHEDKFNIMGGYVTYINQSQQVVNLFYSKFDSSRILVRFVFDSIPTKTPKETITNNPIASAQELDHINLKIAAQKFIRSDKEGFFRMYRNSNLNLIPYIVNNSKKMFIVTGGTLTDTLFLGNDYYMEFNDKYEVTQKQKIHQSLIAISTGLNEKEKTVATVHSHVDNTNITSTDICTLMLHKDYVTWDTHMVFGKENVCVFDMKKGKWYIFPKSAFKKDEK